MYFYTLWCLNYHRQYYPLVFTLTTFVTTNLCYQRILTTWQPLHPSPAPSGPQCHWSLVDHTRSTVKLHSYDSSEQKMIPSPSRPQMRCGSDTSRLIGLLCSQLQWPQQALWPYLNHLSIWRSPCHSWSESMQVKKSLNMKLTPNSQGKYEHETAEMWWLANTV